MERARNLGAERVALWAEGERALNLRADGVAKRKEILNGAEMDVRRFVPRLRKVPRHGHPAVQENLKPDLPMPEIRERHDHMEGGSEQLFQHLLWSPRGLKRLA